MNQKLKDVGTKVWLADINLKTCLGIMLDIGTSMKRRKQYAHKLKECIKLLHKEMNVLETQLDVEFGVCCGKPKKKTKTKNN